MSIFNDCEQLNLFGMTEEDVVKDSLNDKYIIPPFSVFDSKQEYWLSRKRLWMKLGIKSELGRNAKTFSMKDWADKKKEQGKIKEKSLPSDTSIFDPVLCEICYKWFNVKNGNILDPFAGGSGRGIVAGYLGYNYIGIDLSKEQIEANNVNAEEIFGRDRYDKRNNIKWINDDSMNVGNYIKDESADLIFTCPPYFDLEIYSDKKEDLSNMSFDDFVVSYSEILKRCATKLKNNRFAVKNTSIQIIIIFDFNTSAETFYIKASNF